MDDLLKEIGKYELFMSFPDDSKLKIMKDYRNRFRKNRKENLEILKFLIRNECKKYANYYKKMIEKCDINNLCYDFKNVKIY